MGDGQIVENGEDVEDYVWQRQKNDSSIRQRSKNG